MKEINTFEALLGEVKEESLLDKFARDRESQKAYSDWSRSRKRLDTVDETVGRILSNGDRLRFVDKTATYNDGSPLIRNGQLKIISAPKYTLASAFVNAAKAIKNQVS